MMQEFSHLDKDGNAIMVDVSDKEDTERLACACGYILVSKKVISAISKRNVPKGDVLAVARLAGIQAAKRTFELIPLCHMLLLTNVGVDFDIDADNERIDCRCTVKLFGKTGAEMEALTAVSVALLTIYDMCKALDKHMEIGGIRLLEKSGGRSGHIFYENRTDKNV